MTDSRKPNDTNGGIYVLVRRLQAHLERLAQPARDPKTNQVALAFEVIEDLDRLGGEVYRLRSRAGQGTSGLKEAEDFLSGTAHEVLRVTRAKTESEESFYNRFMRQYRSVWQRHLGLFLFAVSIFLAASVLGWGIGVTDGDSVAVIAGQRMMETIHDHRPWFRSLELSPLFDGVLIAWNNIRVALTGFALGACLGFGGLVILIYNGISIGCVMGYCYARGFHGPLLDFVVTHGPLELTMIIASCFSGMLIGRAFYVRPVSRVRAELKRAAHQGASVALGIIPWLVLAACFESFVSPLQTIDSRVKLITGLGLATLFWLWTFSGSAQAKRDERSKP